MPKEVTVGQPNINDAVPTMGYAITALKRSKGDPKSPFFKNYTDAIAHFGQMHGEEASKQLQNLAYSTAMKGGDLNDELTNFSKKAIDTKVPYHPVIKNLLSFAYDGQKPLEKFTYGFDLPATATESTTLPDKLKTLFKK